MKYSRTSYLIIALSLAAFALGGCPKNSGVSSAPEANGTSPAQNGEQKTSNSATSPEAQGGQPERSAAASPGIQPIYFDFNGSVVRNDAREVMKANAEWLKANPTVKVRIEGNCDERGTKEYNQALGQRRAASAKKYLTGLGISARRITLISYGKEKPVCTEGTEECWQKNRRDDFSAASE
jgi:peptidoglycan-associated lipoprotein